MFRLLCVFNYSVQVVLVSCWRTLEETRVIMYYFIHLTYLLCLFGFQLNVGLNKDVRIPGINDAI